MKSFTPEPADPFSEGVLSAELEQRGLSVKDLARMINLTPKALHRSLKDGVPSVRTRCRIEAAMGWVPIWSSPDQVELRRRAFNLTGLDPAVSYARVFYERCKALQIPGIRCPERQCDLERDLYRYLLANPSAGRKSANEILKSTK